jgi:hypothetical protein
VHNATTACLKRKVSSPLITFFFLKSSLLMKRKIP